MRCRREEGFVSIGILLILLIMTSKAITTMEELTNYKLDLKNQRRKIISKYNNESKIYLNIYDKINFQKKIVDPVSKKYREYDYYMIKCLNRECSKKGCGGIGCKGNDDFIYYELDPTKSRKHIRVFARTSFDEVTSFDELYFSILNENFLEDIPINISLDNKGFYNIIKEIYQNNFENVANIYQINNEGNVYLDRVEDHYRLLYDKEYFFNDDENYIFVKNEYNNSNLYINSRDDEGVNINGIIFVDGNIYIDTNFNFNGIMICTGSIFLRDNLYVEGKILCNNIENDKYLTINYREKKVLYYGSYLPGFFNAEIVGVKEG